MKTNSFHMYVVAVLLVLFVFPPDSLQADPPRWAPAHGYRAKTRQIYFPEQNFYFDLKRNVYIYFENGRWISNIRPPQIYANINLMLAPKVELSIASSKPYLHNKTHITMYKAKKGKAVKVKVKTKPGNKKHKRK